MTVVTASLVEAHQRIAMLEALANHQRLCGICASQTIQKCELGWKLWLAAGMPAEVVS